MRSNWGGWLVIRGFGDWWDRDTRFSSRLLLSVIPCGNRSSFVAGVEVGSRVRVVWIRPLYKVKEIPVCLLEEVIKLVDNGIVTVVKFVVGVDEELSKSIRDRVW